MKGTGKKIAKTEVREKFQGEHYPIHVIGRQLEVSDPMKSYALDKLTSALERFGARVIDAHIVMDVQRGIYMVDFLITMNNIKILVSGREKEMYASIDAAIGHLKTKLSRYHQHLHDYDQKKIDWAKHAESGIKPLDDINDMIEEETLKQIESQFIPHPISKREKKPLKTLTEEEAIAKLESSSDMCLIFQAEENRKWKALYRLHDGSYGIVEIE